ncbi:aromatase/cyclase [Streptomyces sp. JJ38]|uniref:aromatase/cyclase n=1 Tax=Streptomyces sp. JJ38 TaxID=2738128 RepID=UPI001C573874|nr:aromatase/cyclase [Streptomyces sp. JJ38]MBW1595762.1 cyclase [Streptomyces sp. JJ38]
MTVREVEHDTVVDASASDVYRVIADVANWPLIFPPAVHVDQRDLTGNQERVRVWASVDGEVRHWTSRRTLQPAAGRITFRQEVPVPPVAAMGGTWIVEPLGEGRCRVRLLLTYRAKDDDAELLARIDSAVDHGSPVELDALRANLELVLGSPELTLVFRESVRIDAPVSDVYDFVAEARHWRDRLPHIVDVDVREADFGLQRLRLETLTGDGSSQTTESLRVRFPHRLVAFKQTTLPALLRLHTGRWEFDEDITGITTATVHHTVVLNPRQIPGVLGPEAGIREAGDFVRSVLGATSRTTLEFAKDHAERARV